MARHMRADDAYLLLNPRCRCTCGSLLLRTCPRHFPALYAETDAKHKAVA